MDEKVSNSGPKTPNINYSQIEEMAEAGCTIEEIAFSIGVSLPTLRKRINRHYQLSAEEFRDKFKGSSNAKIKVKLFQLAINGNPVILTLLARQRGILSEERILIEQETKSNPPIRFNITSLPLVQYEEVSKIETKEDPGKDGENI